MTEILNRYEYNFIKDLIIKRRMQTQTHSKNNFSNDHNLEQPCNLVVKTNNVPIWTFLHFFVLRSLECKILLISKQAFYFKKMIFFNWNPGYLKCVFFFFQNACYLEKICISYKYTCPTNIKYLK